MPLVFDAGTGSSMPGNVVPGGGAPSAATGVIRQFRPFVRVLANGVEVQGVHSGTITHGLDLPYATASLELTHNPDLGNNTEIEIIAGAGVFNATRFKGLLKRRRPTMWPHTYTLLLRGRYALAHEYQQAAGMTIPSFINQRLPITGISLIDLLEGSEPTDQNIVLKVLNRVPNLTVDPSDIGGTGKFFGRLAWRDMAWPPYMRAAAYIQQLDRVCLGYRTFESLNGRIRRVQVRGYPTANADTEFTEGVDIWEASGDLSVEELINGAYVEGYPIGGKPGIINEYLPSSNDLQGTTPHITQFNSPLIEGILDDPEHPELSTGLTPHEVALWLIEEGNRELVNVDLVTFRDDILSPGRTIAVNAPHTGVTQPVWIQRVEIRFSAEPVFWSQRILGFGGGLVGGGGSSEYDPPSPY